MQHEDELLSLALNDDAFVSSVLSQAGTSGSMSHLDPKSRALVRLAAMLALDATPACYVSVVEDAIDSGAGSDEIVGTLLTVGDVIGMARLVSAAPKLALAVGFDIDAALEQTSEIA
jgi:alkylhydroperoxidase/carboxymuconolactone decarboxylase family protein YurZ